MATKPKSDKENKPAAAGRRKVEEDVVVRRRVAPESMRPAPFGVAAQDSEHVTKIAAGGVPTNLLQKLEQNPDPVTVTVPKRFKLRLDNHTVIDIHPGVQNVERMVADHWFSKANGVTVFDPKTGKSA